jgi:uncharacterized protein YhbP (UPF0306 family)
MTHWTEDVTRLLFRSSFMTLATADASGLPWAAPVEFVCDEDLRFYWMSMVDARHSRNVVMNPWAAFTIFDSRQTPGVNAVQGLYGEGPVEVLPPSTVQAVRPSVARWIRWRDEGRKEPRPDSGGRLEAPDSPWRFHRIAPQQLYALDPVVLDEGRLVDSRVPVDLSESFAHEYQARKP